MCGSFDWNTHPVVERVALALSEVEVKTKKRKPVKKLALVKLVIHGNNNQICIDSRDIAIEFGRDHRGVLRSLYILIDNGTISQCDCAPRKFKNRGKEYPCFELNERAFLTAMPFIGGEKAHEGQKRLVDAFIEQRENLAKQSKEREKLSWQVARLSGKDSRGVFTDEINRFVDYAKENGSKNAKNYFTLLTNLVHKTLVTVEPKATQIREFLTDIQLSQLSTIELTAAHILSAGMEAKTEYHVLYKEVGRVLGLSVIKLPLLSS